MRLQNKHALVTAAGQGIGRASALAMAREGAQVRVGYAGSVDYHAVLEHYARGYVERGFTRTVISASPEQEKHRYSGAGAAFDVHIQRSTDGVVQVDIVTGRG